MQFLKNLLTSVLGTLIAFGLFFVLFLIIIAGASASLGAEEAVMVKENSVLKLNINKPILDRSPTEFEFEAALGLEPENLGLDKILASINKAAEDDRIKGISIEHTFLQSGMAQTQAIRKALKAFRDSGKFVYAYHDVYTQKDYYLASVADSVFVHPEGGIDFRGLSAEVLYYKSLQEKSGVQMEVIRHGAYKSAVEPFLSDRMSEEINHRVSDPNPSRAVDPTSPDIPDQRAEVLPSSNYYAQKKQKKTDYTEGFNEFWKRYQSAPRKAIGQKKPLAFEAWKQALQEASAEEITKAIAAAIAEQQQLIKKDQFCAPLPDCFRWLRDECYAVYLEDNAPAPTKSSMFL